MRTLFAGPITRHYVAEWESVLRALRPLAPDWLSTITLPDNSLASEPSLSKELGKLNFSMLGDSELMPDTPDMLRTWTYKSFNRDAVVAADQNAALQVTSQFMPMVERAGFEAVATGSGAGDPGSRSRRSSVGDGFGVQRPSGKP
jgi:hypothetical protein